MKIENSWPVSYEAGTALVKTHLEGFSSVEKPKHYVEGRAHEPIEVIEDWKLGFCLGNVVKYISRAGRKDPSKELEDLKKARWYLDRQIGVLEAKVLPKTADTE
jgi:hypothetical protein